MRCSSGVGRRVPEPGRADTGVLAGAGSVAVVAGCFAAAVVPAHLPGQRLAVLAVAVAGFALVADDAVAALATAGLAWLCCDGFLVDQYGELRWHGHADAVRLGVLALAAATGTGLGWLVRVISLQGIGAESSHG